MSEHEHESAKKKQKLEPIEQKEKVKKKNIKI
jgi:hypothetical protein